MLAALARRIFQSAVVLTVAVVSAQFAHAQYSVTQLVSNLPKVAPHQDTNLVNGWGMTRATGSPFWISDQGTGNSTLYDSKGDAIPLVVKIPVVGTGFTGPSGIVFNGSGDFVVSKNGVSGPALFIFATVDGSISGWNPGVDPTNAIVAVNKWAEGVSYNGLAIDDSTNQLFATDNAHNRIDVYDGSFKLTKTLTDPSIPEGFSAYGIRQIAGQVFVTFASTGNAPGGFIDIFSDTGALVKRFAQGAPLNQPWGLALAPPTNFGPFSGALLVSNNTPGGQINAFNFKTGKFLGTLKRPDGRPIEIDQVWALDFGGGSTQVNGATNQLFFSAGPSNYANGAFGVINFVK